MLYSSSGPGEPPEIHGRLDGGLRWRDKKMCVRYNL